MGANQIELKEGETVFEYDIKINKKGGKYYAKPYKRNGEPISQFRDVNKKGVPKIYVVINNEEIIYIGGAKSPFNTRLRGGLNDEKYGYKWKDLPDVKVFIIILPDEYDNPAAIYHTPHGIEAIEGELVYRVRQRGDWPRYQTEIHFHSVNEITRGNVADIAQYLRRKGIRNIRVGS